MDLLLCEHFAGLFEKKTKLDVLGNAKAKLKLTEASAKAKKILSSVNIADVLRILLLNYYPNSK